MGFSINGLNHLALVVEDMSVARRWFVNQLGLKILEDRGELLFLLAGSDIIALKTPKMAVAKPEHGGESNMTSERSGRQNLDHYGFFAQTPQEVDEFSEFLRQSNIEILKGPYDRSDGRSIYFRDPCGFVGEYFFFSPPN